MRDLKIIFAFCVLLPYCIHGQTKKINIVRADQLEYKKEVKDAQLLRGNVIMEHDGAFMYCDSAYLFLKSNSFNAYNNIKIEQGDSIKLTGDTLYYDGNKKSALIKGNVQLIEKDIQLTCSDLNYDLNNKTAYYYSRANIYSTQNQNKLTSIKGAYKSKLKTLYFKDSVVLEHPNYKMTSDTLSYQTQTEIAFFSGPSIIESNKNTIYCNKGWYDTKNEKSSFWNQATIESDKRTISGDSIFYNRNDGIGEVFRNVYLSDTIKKYQLKGDYAYHDEINDSSIVKGNAMLEQHYEDDTLQIESHNFISIFDSLDQQFLRSYGQVKIFKSDIQGTCDSISYKEKDSVMELFNSPFIWSNINQVSGDYIELNYWDGNIHKMNIYNNSMVISEVDSNYYNQVKGKDMIGSFIDNKLKKIHVIGNGETIYFLANKENEPVIDFNKTTCSEITMLLDSNEMKVLNFTNTPNSVLKPISSSSEEERKLKGFIWEPMQRPTKKTFTENEKLDIRR